MSLAYEQLYSIYGAGCYGCDTSRAMENVYIDGQPLAWQVANSSSDNFMEIEPVTGVLTRMRRSYTMVFTLACYEH